jgi:hypothetical protein
MDASNPFEQARKYSAKWRILVTNHVPTAQEATKRRVTFINWAKVGSTLRDLTASRNPILKFLSDNLLRYLEDHNMVRERESVEIYAREINEETTLKLFLKARLYGCDYQRSSRLPEALYFAPHFGRSIAQLYPGINTGISYIAKIDTVAVVETWDELIAIAKASRGTTWLRLNRDYLEAIHRKWPWKSVRYSFVFLDSPRLVFNPPIKKTHLQSGSGRLSRRTFSFDEMFQAWGK